MTRAQAPPRPDGSDDALLVIVGGLAAAAVGGHWLVGNVAALIGRGRFLRASLGDAAQRARRAFRSTPPTLALPGTSQLGSNLPGPVLYWLATALVLLLAATVAAVVVHRLGSHRHEPPDKRRRLGVETQARLATARSSTPADPPAGTRPFRAGPVGPAVPLHRGGDRARAPMRARGRGSVRAFAIRQDDRPGGRGRGMGGPGRGVVSQDRPAPGHGGEPRAARGGQGVRSPRHDRHAVGELEPAPSRSGLAGALAAAQVLARAGAEEAPNDRFWRGQAEQLIAAMLWTAANTEGHTMRNVVRWVLELDRPQGDDGGTLAAARPPSDR